MSTGPTNAAVGPTRTGATAPAVLLLGLLAGLLCFTTRQDYLWNDGPKMAAAIAQGGRGGWSHVLGLPLASWVRGLLGAVGGVEAFLVVSAVSAGIAVGGLVLVLRSLGAELGSAAVVAALAALSPALWFHGSTVEFHALHAAAVVLAALLVVNLPYGRGGRAGLVLSIALATLLFGALQLVHRSSIWLGPGFVLLVIGSAQRRGVRLNWPTGLAAVGPACLLAGVLGLGLAESIATGAPFAPLAGVNESAAFAGHFAGKAGHAGHIAYLWSDWIAVSPLLVLLLAIGTMHGARRVRARLALAALLAPLAFFVWMREPSLGGYALGALPFLAIGAECGVAAIAARVAAPRVRATLVAAALLASAVLGWRTVHDPVRTADGRVGLARVADLRELLPDGGYVLSAAYSYQLVSARWPAVIEWNVAWDVQGVAAASRPVQDVVDPLMVPLDQIVAAFHGRVVWDTGWRTERDRYEALETYVAPLEALIARRYEREVIVREDREYWRLLGPRDSDEP